MTRRIEMCSPLSNVEFPAINMVLVCDVAPEMGQLSMMFFSQTVPSHRSSKQVQMFFFQTDIVVA